MPGKSAGKRKEQQPLLVVLWYGLEVGCKNRIQLQEGSVFSHRIPLPSGLEKELKKDEIRCIAHWEMKDLRLHRRTG